MKKLFYFFLVFISFFTRQPLHAQMPNQQWEKFIGSYFYDRLYALQQTSDGGYILGGYSNAGISMDKTEINYGGNDYWVVKTDANGNKLWDKSFGGSGEDLISSIQQTSDGGYIIGGYSNSPVSGNKTSANKGGNDYWIIKLDAGGNKSWEKSFGGTNDDLLYSLQQTSDSGYILGGYSNSGNNGDKSQPAKGYSDFWIIKSDGAGNKTWDKTIGGSYNEFLAELRQTADGGYILGGTSDSPISGDKSINNKGDEDFWVVKLAANGTKQWDKVFGGVGKEKLSSIKQTLDGGYIVGGNSYSLISGDRTPELRGYCDYWVLKLDTNGNKVWDKAFGGYEYNKLTCLQQTADGGYIVGGTFDSGGEDFAVVKLTATGAKVWDKVFENTQSDMLTCLQQTTDGGFIFGGFAYKNSEDFKLIKLGPTVTPKPLATNKIWDKVIGTNSDEILTTMQTTSDGGYILGGYTLATINGDKSQNCLGSYDYWIIKLDGSGQKIWDKTFGGNGQDYLSVIQRTIDGGYILGGWSESQLSGDKSQDGLGGYDYWVVKVSSNGTKQWDKTFSGIYDDKLFALQQTTDGGYILGGWSASPVSADKSQPSKGYEDFWIIKIDANGNKLWDKVYGGNNPDWFCSLEKTSDGGFILGGSSGSDSGDKTQRKGGIDYWVVKLDASGNMMWQKSIGGWGDNHLVALHQTASGSYILGGYSNSSISGDKTQMPVGSGVYFDYWIVKLNSAGTKIWDMTIGGNKDDILTTLRPTSDGGFIYGGYSTSGISPSKSQASKGLEDFWVLKSDSTRLLGWEKTLGGCDSDKLAGLLETSDGNYIIGGTSNTGICGDKSEGSLGFLDFWLVKVGTNITGTKKFAGRDIDNKKASISIFPNPGTGTFYLEMPTVLQGSTSLKVYNRIGELVAEKEITIKNHIHQLDLSYLPKGIYLLKISNQELSVTKKIIIE
jgi:hypothetical protein